MGTCDGRSGFGLATDLVGSVTLPRDIISSKHRQSRCPPASGGKARGDREAQPIDCFAVSEWWQQLCAFSGQRGLVASISLQATEFGARQFGPAIRTNLK